MKPTNAPSAPPQRKPLKVDPAKVRDWQNRSRQAPLKRASKPLKQKPVKGTNSTLNRMSEKLRKDLPRRAAIRLEVFERDNWTCQLAERLKAHPDWPAHECEGPLTVHHITKAAQGGEFEPSNLVSVCLRGNADFIERYPPEARALGLVKSYEDRSDG